VSEGHSPPEGRREVGKSGHEKKSTERETLTSWKPQRETPVRTQKESHQSQVSRVRDTHGLATAGGTCHDIEESNRARGTHRLEGRVRIPKESDRKMVTHQLETTGRGTSEDAEKRQQREGHPQTGDRRGRYKSRHGKKQTEGRGGSPT
jgi:hypothetical protein